MPHAHLVPHEVVAQARARLSRDGIDARPVYVVGPDREDGEVEFFTAAGLVWPVVLRLDGEGVVATPVDADPAPGPSPLSEALDRLTDLLSAATPREPAPEAAE
ncbi:hypothetical protein C882_1654 [Caenispirillum salinarum AK4]|uniref:Uncharacterized protein n=1 Tax=Caenispirillum salinarum AK4 TaxID=1238182 RepID=K9HXB4_9PROT|nr:hypothetical protein [Caenispirillum salinarum]EKV32816.1 hypothetical protein C882_1654 [Caenispirillum salinarum AK4]